MNDLKPAGTFPTPYGIAVPVYHPMVVDPADPDLVLFSMDATAICAGIYDKRERARFSEDAQRIGGMPAFEEYGGHSLPRTPLPKPRTPAYPRISGMEVDIPVEAWTTGVMDRHRWCDRAEFLIDIIGENSEAVAGDNDLVTEIYPIGLSITLTAALEHLCEREIDCIEAAALYAMTEHDEWQAAALAWLYPFRDTWFRDWRRARPRYDRFAASLGRLRGLPSWFGKTGGAA